MFTRSHLQELKRRYASMYAPLIEEKFEEHCGVWGEQGIEEDEMNEHKGTKPHKHPHEPGEEEVETKESELSESVHDKKTTFTMAPFEDLRSVADAALKIMTRQPQEVKEEEKEEVTKEDQPQQLTE